MMHSVFCIVPIYKAMVIVGTALSHGPNGDLIHLVVQDTTLHGRMAICYTLVKRNSRDLGQVRLKGQ